MIFVERYEEGSYEGEVNEAKNPEGQVGGNLVSSHEICSKNLCCKLASLIYMIFIQSIQTIQLSKWLE